MVIVARILPTVRLVILATGFIVATPMMLSDVRAQQEDSEQENIDACESLGCAGGDLVCAEYDETRIIMTIDLGDVFIEFLETETVICYESRS